MSLTRISMRTPAAFGRNCTRCFASSAQRSAADPLLDILSESTKSNSKPFSFSRKNRGSSLASRMGKELLPDRASTVTHILESERKSHFQRQMYRKWQPGDVYAPRDLSGTEQRKWKTGRKMIQTDAFDMLGINPITEYKNTMIMSEYMTETGRIKHSRETGLRPKNQRKIAKAIRRAVGLGLMPSVHRHPLVVKKALPMKFK